MITSAVFYLERHLSQTLRKEYVGQTVIIWPSLFIQPLFLLYWIVRRQ